MYQYPESLQNAVMQQMLLLKIKVQEAINESTEDKTERFQLEMITYYNIAIKMLSIVLVVTPAHKKKKLLLEMMEHALKTEKETSDYLQNISDMLRKIDEMEGRDGK